MRWLPAVVLMAACSGAVQDLPLVDGGTAGGSSGGGEPGGGAVGGGVSGTGGAGGGSVGGGSAGGGSVGGGSAGGGSAGGGSGGSGGGAPSCANITGDRRTQVCLRWNCDRMDRSEGTWNGMLQPACMAGDMTAAARANALKMINLYRFIADLPAVTTAAMRDAAAQECALMMDANNMLDHSPPSTWACYTATGAMAAGTSNICSGRAVACIDLYMSDFGSGNAASLGHRRWLLSNSLGPVGIGGTPGGSCHWVIGGSGNAGKAWVAWPPPGPVPLAAINIPGVPSIDSTGWSVQGYSANVNNATVTVTDNGQNLPVTTSNLLANYGSSSAIKFIPMGWTAQAGHTYQVTVSGGGLTTPISYSVQVEACPP